MNVEGLAVERARQAHLQLAARRVLVRRADRRRDRRPRGRGGAGPARPPRDRGRGRRLGGRGRPGGCRPPRRSRRRTGRASRGRRAGSPRSGRSRSAPCWRRARCSTGAASSCAARRAPRSAWRRPGSPPSTWRWASGASAPTAWRSGSARPRLGRAGALVAAAASAWRCCWRPRRLDRGFAVMGLGLAAVFPLALRAAGYDPAISGPAVAAVSSFGYWASSPGRPRSDCSPRLLGLGGALACVCGLLAGRRGACRPTGTTQSRAAVA